MTNITFIKYFKYPAHFYSWLWKNIQKTYILYLTPSRLSVYVQYLDSIGIKLNNRRLYVLLCRYVLSGKIVQMKKHYQIIFNSRMQYNEVYISDLFNLVEYGNLSLRGLGILTSIKNDRVSNLNRYWNIYKMLYEPGG